MIKIYTERQGSTNKRMVISMSATKVSEIIASSKKSFADAIERGVERANKTLKNVKNAWVKINMLILKRAKLMNTVWR